MTGLLNDALLEINLQKMQSLQFSSYDLEQSKKKSTIRICWSKKWILRTWKLMGNLPVYYSAVQEYRLHGMNWSLTFSSKGTESPNIRLWAHSIRSRILITSWRYRYDFCPPSGANASYFEKKIDGFHSKIYHYLLNVVLHSKWVKLWLHCHNYNLLQTLLTLFLY